MTAPYTILGGGALVLDWRITHQRFFTFEADLDALERLAPPALAVVEVRPGMGLVSVGLVRMTDNSRPSGVAPMDELFTVIHVAPDLSLPMPNAKFSFLIHSVWSNSEAFVAADLEHIAAPVMLEPSLRLEFDEVALTARADSDGGAIVELRYQDAHPTWSHTSFVGQHFTDQAGLRLGAWHWSGERAECMRTGSAGTFHDHAFWRGLDTNRIRRPYRQMIKRPGTSSHERFYAMRSLG
ncbi:MAG: hypothetical protein IT355_20350 [Gemmatimonadaceae bacterium]|nr:hypothetical protein [Gemmatimonadaceae bacterium]